MVVNAINWKILCELDKCFICGWKGRMYKEKESPEIIDGKLVKMRANGEYFAHLFSTHGLPPEDVKECIKKLLTKELSQS